MNPNTSNGEPPRRNRRDRATAWRLSTGDDLEHALRAAERLLAQAEDRYRHEQNRTFAYLSVIAGTALSLIASLVAILEFASYSGSGTRTVAAVVTAGATLVVLLFMVQALFRQRRRVSLDYSLRLATQMSSMISEALVDVAEREEWSYLRLEATRLRLSAFPLADPFRDSGD